MAASVGSALKWQAAIVSRSLRERVPFNARTAKSNFALVCSLKPGIAGEGLETAAFGKGDANFGDVLLAAFPALAMTRFRLSARTCSVVFGLTSVTVEFMALYLPV